MPRRSHSERLQRVEWRSGTCVCRQPLILICAKAIAAYERGELVTEPCPAGCAPETRKVVVLNLSAWRSDEACACPTCAPSRQKRPAVPETVAAAQLALPAPAGASPDADASEPHLEPPDAPAPAAGPDAGLVEALPASEATVEVARARVSVPVGGPTPQLGPEDAVGGPEAHGPCAIPWCHHPLEAHRCYSERLPCRHCGWPVHDHDGFEPGLSYVSRRAMPCGTYIAIRYDGGEWDGCAVDGCGCPGWRRTAPYVSEREEAKRALLAEKARVIAGKAALLARLKAEHEERQLELLRAQGLTDNGPSPHGCPVYIEGESA